MSISWICAGARRRGKVSIPRCSCDTHMSRRGAGRGGVVKCSQREATLSDISKHSGISCSALSSHSDRDQSFKSQEMCVSGPRARAHIGQYCM